MELAITPAKYNKDLYLNLAKTLENERYMSTMIELPDGTAYMPDSNLPGFNPPYPELIRECSSHLSLLAAVDESAEAERRTYLLLEQKEEQYKRIVKELTDRSQMVKMPIYIDAIDLDMEGDSTYVYDESRIVRVYGESKEYFSAINLINALKVKRSEAINRARLDVAREELALA